MFNCYVGFASVAKRGHVKGGVVLLQLQAVLPFVGGQARAVGIAGVDREPEACYGGSGVSVFGVVVAFSPVRKDFSFAG